MQRNTDRYMSVENLLYHVRHLMIIVQEQSKRRRYGMKFERFRYKKSWDWIFILPTVCIFINEMIYGRENFSIEFHWLGWHFMWLWLKEG